MTTVDIAEAPTREAIITGWYERVFPRVCQYLHKRGRSLDDARELFQEAVVLYYEKLVSQNSEVASNDEAYLMGIVKKLWLKQLNSERKKENLDGIDFSDTKEPEPSVLRILEFLKQTGAKCMNLLQAFYYDNSSMKEISSQFGFGSERSATVQKYKCLEKVRNSVKQKSLEYEDFLD